jgi:hypothetical protein
MFKLVAYLLLGALVSSASAAKSYSGYNVIRVTPKNLEQVELLKKLESQGVIFR